MELDRLVTNFAWIIAEPSVRVYNSIISANFTQYVGSVREIIYSDGIVTDKGNGGQPACPEEWKK